MSYIMPAMKLPGSLVALAFLAGCSGGRPYDWPRSGQGAPRPKGAPGQPPARSGAAVRPEEAAPSCASAQYRFECSVPRGYLLTQERPGPGTIMVFVKRSRASEDEANLTVKVTALTKGTLESFVERRIARDLKKAKSVKKWTKEAAVIGDRSGVEILIERAYASGPYRSRIFCFQEGENVFIVDHELPELRYEREKSALDAFVESLAFTES